MESYDTLFISALIGFVVSLGVCFGIITLSSRLHFFVDSATSDKPQRFHTDNTSRAGGLGIFVACVCACVIFFGFDKPILGLLFGSLIIFLSGLAEDFSSALSPKLRLLLQCFGAFLACYTMHTYISDLSIGFQFPYVVGILFSIFALVGVTNATNIIDGFNGLASGVCLLIFVAIAVVAYEVQDWDIFQIAILTTAAILGFFVLNFPYGKIFLGDGGAYFLGFLAGFLLVSLTQNTSNGVSAWFGLSLMIYPVWEVLFSIFRKKIKRGLSPMQPDGVHFHMLIYKRLTKGNAKTSLWILTLYTPFVVLSVVFAHHSLALIGISLVFIVFYQLIYKRLATFRL
ncbi:glycosyltransferase family 4 protein [uncultured Helicobacter sp.]|uniref:glycosyltransferase family 4 protein n=1 Tax=uncultured Helicobacter sp. TaxID=175537 RepID=UPI001C3BF27E|nr:undecaprenyl/decaprenyl-phosphate alpha-N-acetylglucosaminyl 1-phosphate transferase [Candidatus Helicobacter avicola]